MSHTTNIPIRKMHCRSCELMIEDALRALPGVQHVEASVRNHRAVIRSEGPIDLNAAEGVIKDAGYDVGEEAHPAWITTDADEYAYLVIAGFIVAALYLLADRTGLLDLSMAGAGGNGLVPALLIGLTAGVSTCMALIGGLTLGISARHADLHPEATGMQKFRPHVFFNIGRVAGFFVLGGTLGVIGSVVMPGGVTLGVITLAVAALMLVMGVQLLDLSPALGAYKLTLPSSVARMLGIRRHHTREYNHRGAVLLGALTFFVPCGFTQLMQIQAVASGGFVPGGLLMGAFALGTTPGLLGIGGLTSAVRGLGAKIFFKTAGLAVIALALFNVSNGYNLTGWEPFWTTRGTAGAQAVQNVTIENGVQIARMTQSIGGYAPNTFTVEKGKPVRWIINATDPSGCSGGISVPSLALTRYFEPGENIIEFTPTDAGVIRFSCTMGMYPGQFTVIDPSA